MGLPVVLGYGLGSDSTTILRRYLTDPAARLSAAALSGLRALCRGGSGGGR